jgi:serine phosphatase RsbU (regulator of sigma subunit)
MLTLDAYRTIPDEFKNGFLEAQRSLIRSRVNLLCLLSFVLYLLSSLLWFFLYPQEYTNVEALIGLVLVTGGIIVLFFNNKANSLVKVKANSYFFIVLLLILLVKTGIVYEDDTETSAATMVFLLFLVSVTIPWNPRDILFLTIFHLAAYSFNFIYLGFYDLLPADLLAPDKYIGGFIFIIMAGSICWIVRKKETEREVENFVLFKDVEKKNILINKELTWATKVHRTIIPRSIKDQSINIGVTYKPVYYIGGDYVRYDFLDEDRVLFLISDVTGHGIPAALLVNRLHAEFQRFVKEQVYPGELLRRLNGFIREDFSDAEMYLTAFCGLVDTKKMKFYYSNYGHPPQFLYSRSRDSVQSMPAQTYMLGLPVDDDGTYQQVLKLEREDRILLYTDGITETRNAEGDEYGEERLRDYLRAKADLGVNDFNRALISELENFKDGDFRDDICLLCSEVLGRHGFLFHRG